MSSLHWRLVGAILLATSVRATAGPPYGTDDPEPTDFRHWEIYNFVDLGGRGSDLDGEGGLDVNYGAAKDLQLTATLPVAFSHESDTGWHGGRGDVELAAKYRFVNDEQHGWQAAIFPRLFLPTSVGHLGAKPTRLLLPLWVQKDFGKTSLFGGGGYEINPGRPNRDFWQAGIVVTREISDTLQLGAEFNWQSADTRGAASTAGLDIGIIKKLGGPFELLGAAGPSSSSGKTGYHAYAALGLNF